MHNAVAADVSAFAPINPFGGSGEVTWHHLSSQLSGLERAGPAACTASNCSNAEALAEVRQRFLKWPPGTHPAYSNWAFGLLGNLLSGEILKDSTFAASVASRITEPLGLANTGMEYTAEVLQRLAVGYTGGKADPFVDLGYVAPAGSAYSTATDLTTYAQTLLAAFYGVTEASSTYLHYHRQYYLHHHDHHHHGTPLPCHARMHGCMYTRTHASAFP